MRKFSLVLSLILLISMVASVPAVAEEKITLTVLDCSDTCYTYRQEATEKWLESHPNVEVEYTLTTWGSLGETIMAGISSGVTPDLFACPQSVQASDAISNGWYLPLSDYVDETAFDNWIDGTIMEGKGMQDGKVYMVPEQGSIASCLVLYNKDLWAAAGLTEEDIPETYSEFREVARILTDAGNGKSYGIVEGAAQISRVWVDLACWADYSGGFYMTEDYLNLQTGMPDWNTQEIYDLMQLWADLYADGSIHPNSATQQAPDARAQFANGQAGMIIQGWWNVGDWSVNYPDLNFGVFAPPVSDTAYENGVKGFFPVETPTPFMGISANCEYPEIAADYLMNVICGVDYQQTITNAGVQYPFINGMSSSDAMHPLSKEYFSIVETNQRIIPEPILLNKDTAIALNLFMTPTPTPAEILQGVMSGQITDFKPLLENYTTQASAAWLDALEEAQAMGANVSINDFAFPEWDGTTNFDAAAYEAHRAAQQ